MPSLSTERASYPLQEFTQIVKKILVDVMHHSEPEADVYAGKMTADIIYEAAFALDVPVDETLDLDLQHAYQVYSQLQELSIPDEDIAVQLSLAAHSLIKRWMDGLATTILTDEDRISIMKIMTDSMNQSDT